MEEINRTRMTKLSIIVTAFNQQKYIYNALMSIYLQKAHTPFSFEVIIVDDASVDNSQAIIQDFIQTNELQNQFKFYPLATNGGASVARNFALKKCSGEYVAFLDGDDNYDDSFINKAITIIEQYNGDFLISRYAYRSLHSIFSKTLDSRELSKYMLRLDNNIYLIKNVYGLLSNNFDLGVGNVVAKKSKLNGCLFDESLSMFEDSAFWLAAIESNNRENVIFLDGAFYYYNLVSTETSACRSAITNIDAIKIPRVLHMLEQLKEYDAINYRKKMVIVWLYNNLERIESWTQRLCFMRKHFWYYLRNFYTKMVFFSPLMLILLPRKMVIKLKKKILFKEI